MLYQDTIPHPCARCGSIFEMPSFYLRRGPRHFCSRLCMREWFSLIHRRAGLPLAERFWPKVLRLEEAGACWIWQASRNRRGYGCIYYPWPISQKITAHRAAWELASGALPPPNRFIGHTCDTPACVRNDDCGTYEVNGVLYPRYGHLFLCNIKINAEDMVAKGRSVRGDRHFTHSHPERVARGERTGTSVLTDDLVRRLRADYATGQWSYCTLAWREGVSEATVRRAVSRTSWAHIA